MIRKTEKPILISVVGPTAIGKTALAIAIARKYSSEIISCDSRQFYIELEIGTAKPSRKELSIVPHHLINHLSIHDYYSVGKFEKEALSIIARLHITHPIAVMVGGSGLYCQAIWEGIDEMPEIDLSIREALNQQFAAEGIEPLQKELKAADPQYYALVDQQNHARLIRALEVIRSSKRTYTSFRKGMKALKRPFKKINIGLEMETGSLYQRIEQRMDEMIENGLFAEAEKYFDYRNLNALRTVGYQEIYGYFEGQYDKKEAIRLLKRNSRRYAKRQLTWFKKNKTIQWFSVDHPEEGKNKIFEFLEQQLS